MASGGVIVPPDGYLRRVREICRRNDILYISDEVVTAFGRVGEVFASKDVFDIEPDMITFAKGVTSGYFPLGGVMISERLTEQLRRSNHPEAMFAHGLTYSSHPVGCAVALRNLDLLEGGILDHVRTVAPYFQQQLEDPGRPAAGREVRGVGPHACVECVADRESGNPLKLDKRSGQADRQSLPGARPSRAAAHPYVRDVAAPDHHPGADRRHGRHPARGHFPHQRRSASRGPLERLIRRPGPPVSGPSPR